MTAVLLDCIIIFLDKKGENMKGKNTLLINQATMKDAIHRYLDDKFTFTNFKVNYVHPKDKNNDGLTYYDFEVEIEEIKEVEKNANK
jgi:hypothetical protein